MNSQNKLNPAKNKKLISIIIPVYNEEDNILLIYKEIANVWQNLDCDYNYEIIFINDGSKDRSNEIIIGIAHSDYRIRYIEFSKNFGKEIAVSAGIHNAKGGAAIMIDADLQHPPELIPEFLKKWQNGAEMVIGVRRKHNGESLFKKIGSFCFYKIMNLIGETKLINGSTDFRLIDKKIINEFNRFTERNRITRGLLDWLGFKKDYVYFYANKRENGNAQYSKLKLIKLALSSFVSLSLFPLRFAGYLGIFITVISGLLGLFIAMNKYMLADPFGFAFSGPAILAVFNSLLIGIVLSCFGLMALYIANIHGEVINRPMYVVRERINFE